jgi:phosphoribosylanthranilate isomerase
MKIKICGIVHPDDAVMSAAFGADYIGAIFSPDSKRCVDAHQGEAIAKAARENGAVPVAVFVDETADQILELTHQAGIDAVQLHGDSSRMALEQLLPHFTTIFYVIDVHADGTCNAPPFLPTHVIPLYDSFKNAKIKPFDLSAFAKQPKGPFFLGGGLSPTNVREAVHLTQPTGLDIAGGVEKPNSLRKDPTLIKQFIQFTKGIPS